MVFYAIGDVHGCFKRLMDLYTAILDHHQTHHPDDEYKIIFLGDYVDRGSESDRVISFLMMLDSEKHVVLPGNHEDMLLDFIEHIDDGNFDLCGRYLDEGGLQTLRSYCRHLPDHLIHKTSNPDFETVLDARYRIPASHIEWISELLETDKPYYLDHQNKLLFVHAGIRMNQHLDDHSTAELLWTRGYQFLNDVDAEPLEDLTVIHGHTPAEEPMIRNKRIGVDTGCFFTGTLTAAVMVDGRLSGFLSCTASKTHFTHHK